MDDGIGVALRKFQDIGEVGSPPGVDRLGIISDDHDVLVRGGEGVDQSGLEAVGVLIFVNKNGSETTLVRGGDLGIGQEQFVGF